MIRPECALLGTVAISPAFVWCRCDTGERAPMRAPGVRGKPTRMPATSPLPASSSVPRVETWRGFALHRTAGTQATLVMRTLVTCRLGVPGVAPAGAPPAVAPWPRLAASERDGPPRRLRQARAAATAAAASRMRSLVELWWADLAAKAIPLPSGRLAVPNCAAFEVSRSALANRAARRKLRQPQRKPAREGAGGSGLDGRSFGVSGRL
jgi:hypothetical protein